MIDENRSPGRSTWESRYLSHVEQDIGGTTSPGAWRYLREQRPRVRSAKPIHPRRLRVRTRPVETGRGGALPWRSSTGAARTNGLDAGEDDAMLAAAGNTTAAGFVGSDVANEP
jgi:hypothetical protein